MIDNIIFINIKEQYQLELSQVILFTARGKEGRTVTSRLVGGGGKGIGWKLKAESSTLCRTTLIVSKQGLMQVKNCVNYMR